MRMQEAGMNTKSEQALETGAHWASNTDTDEEQQSFVCLGLIPGEPIATEKLDRKHVEAPSHP